MDDILKFGELSKNIETNNTEHTTTDCRSDVGITVGLIDGLISICRVLKERLSSDEQVLAALKDLQGDEDLQTILNFK